MASIIQAQREGKYSNTLILDTVRNTARGEWKVLVVDEASRKIIDNVVKEDDILNEKITNIEQIEQRRPMNKEMDVVYILSPQPHIVDCLMADFERRRYRRTFLIWTSLLPPALRERIDKSPIAQQQIALFSVLSIDYFPRESHVVTFRDPWSFPILFHPGCNNLVRQHLENLAQKIVSVCVALGEYPTIRYYRPRNPTHEASVLCSHLARFVQDEIDMYAQFHESFPPASNRPRGTLYIVDRSMDLFAPFMHEFTYQAMAHDLLPIKEGDRITYKTIVNEGRPDQEEKEVEISEKDKIWVQNRHRHMKDTIEKLMNDFQKFVDQNPHFTNTSNGNTSSLNDIKDMLAGLPQFQEMKQAYSLHLSMAQDCMNIFQQHKLPDVASVEQSLATGLDEDYRKPKNLADQLVRTLDEESVIPPDRLRLIALYLLYKDGLLPSDLTKLLAHAQLPPQDAEVIRNLDHLGARVAKPLKDAKPPPPPLFTRKPPPAAAQEEYALSRYETALKLLLEEHVRGALDQTVFPYTKPHMDATTDGDLSSTLSQTSLRSAKPTWAKTRSTVAEPKQRVVVFMAGGATYSEARACYEVSRASNRDVFLVTSHMLTPGLFMRQAGDLSVDKRKLSIPAEMPKPKAPAWVFEKEEEMRKPTLPQKEPVPTAAMGNLSLGSGKAGAQPAAQKQPGPAIAAPLGKATKELEKPEKEKKKKHHFFSSRK